MSHENICRLLAFSEDGPSRCLILELCTGGALDDRLACKAPSAEPLVWQHRVHISLGVARALDHLHGLTPQMIHRCADTLVAGCLLLSRCCRARWSDP